MRDSVPSLRYSPICNVLRQWKTSLIYGGPEGRPHTGSSNGRSVFRVRTSALPLGRSACPHRQSPYAMRGSACPHRQSPYAMRGSARPHRQSPYAMRGSALPHRQSPSPCEGPHFRIASRHARVRMSASPVAMRGSARIRPHRQSPYAMRGSARPHRQLQLYIKRAQLASVFSRKSSKDFWASVKRTTRLETTLKTSVIDGVRGDYNIAELWASKLKDLLNTNHNDWRDFSQLINGHISFASLSELSVTPVDVRRSLQNLKTGKKDVDNLSSDHLRHAATVIAESLATLFTSILRHGYMPSSLRDCTVIPIPKGLKDASCSSNYRGIAIASTLSKVLEGVILHKYSEFFTSSDLQFGFKPGHSTTLCTGVVKCTISR